MSVLGKKTVLLWGVMFVIVFNFPISPSLNREVDSVHHEYYTDIFNKNVDLKNGKALLLFFDPGNYFHKISLFYAQALSRKFESLGLTVVGIAKDKPINPDVKNLIEKMQVRYPIIIDTGGIIHDSFDVKKCCGATVYLTKDGIKHRFESLLEPEPLRQLVEKEMKGKIDYELNEVEQHVFSTGEKCPSIELTYGSSGQLLHLPDLCDKNGRCTVVTFFSSLCGVCKSGKRIDLLNRLDREFIEIPKDAKISMVLMIPLIPQDIPELNKLYEIPFDLFFSGYIFSEEEKYLTDSSIKKDPFSIVLDSACNIIFVEKTGMSDDELKQEIFSLKQLKRGDQTQ